MKIKKRILVAPLNWGLGHATRCIPIIEALLVLNFEPILASDGAALALLQKEFPELKSVELPSYNIEYSKNGYFFKLKLIKDTPKLLKTIKEERNITKTLVQELELGGIISDNRFGIYSKKIPSVFMTHQLRVLSGSTTWLSSKLHQRIIKKFDECWVPDHRDQNNLSGKLGHLSTETIKIKYIGPISRLRKLNTEIKNDILILLSGPEPQRTLLEKKLILLFRNYPKRIILVRGVITDTSKTKQEGSIIMHDFMTSKELERVINESKLVISRSGYTTIMDLAKLNKMAYYIPTPGQFEQEYLAKSLRDKKMIPSCAQDKFELKNLEEINNYKGFREFDFDTNYKSLFRLF